ncbi:MAG: hypothetical protein K9M15_01650 [Candidatus Marinimicrobia bacterium]|nr:hypothetical protein [Candidatus Neomarinimicrobiota bacterium]
MNILEKMKKTAEDLYKTRMDIKVHADKFEKYEIEMKRLLRKAKMDFDQNTAGMREKRDKLQEELMTELTKNELSSIKVKSGESFSIQSRPSVEITDNDLAESWAEKNSCLVIKKSIDKKTAKEILESMDKKKWPKCISLIETPYISVRKATKKAE